MSLTTWMRQKRLNNLRVSLAGARAAERVEREIADKVRQVSPVTLVLHAQRVAELEEQIRQLEAEMKP